MGLWRGSRPGVITWWTQRLFTCVLVLLVVVTPMVQGRFCVQVTECLDREYDMAIINNDKEALCRVMPKTIKCFDAAREVCGDLGKRFNAEYDKFVTNYQEDCQGEVEEPKVDRVKKPSPEECSETEMEKCLSSELRRATQEKDKEALCRVGPKDIQCMEAFFKRCDIEDPLMVQSFTNLKKEVLSECNNSATALQLSISVLLACLTTLLCSYIHRII